MAEIKNEISDYLSAIGKKGGSVKSDAKAAASMANGKKGGSVKSDAKAAAAKENGQGGGRPSRHDIIRKLWADTRDPQKIKGYIRENIRVGTPAWDYAEKTLAHYVKLADLKQDYTRKADATIKIVINDLIEANNAVLAEHPRGIFFPDRADCLIDKLREMGYTEKNIPLFKEVSSLDTGNSKADYLVHAGVVAECFDDPPSFHTDEEKLFIAVDLSVFDAVKRIKGNEDNFGEFFIDNMKFFGYSDKDLPLIRKSQKNALKSGRAAIASHGDYSGLLDLLDKAFSV
jgi:hypothetical protein